MRLARRLRDLPGVVVRDLSRYRAALANSGRGKCSDPAGWISLCNRDERLRRQDSAPGYVCDWQWGSPLHAPEVLPSLGQRLLAVAMAEWPVAFAVAPPPIVSRPQLSFVLALGGASRVQPLITTLKSLFAQEDVSCEFIVVDQSLEPQFARLPAGVIYRHLDKSNLALGWYKSWAFNVGARLANADVIVFHDGDICVPSRYARELMRALGESRSQVASIQRLLFYLGREDSELVSREGRIPPGAVPRPVFQNWKGGTIAVKREAFFRLGGFDEGFVDWGGEDDEFFDRCSEVGHNCAGYLPFVHLWHPPQAGRMAHSNPNTSRVLPRRLAIPRGKRIDELCTRMFGSSAGPDPVRAYD